MGESKRPAWIWGLVVVLALMGPVVLSFATWVVLSLFAGNIDVAWGLGISDEAVNGIYIGVGGFLAGLATGFAARIRGWNVTVPASIGLAMGLAVYLAYLWTGTEYGEVPVWLVWSAQTVAILIGTWLTPMEIPPIEKDKPREAALLT